MDFNSLMKDKIRIKKGDIYSEYMKANVSAGLIITYDVSFNIEEGDIVERYIGDNVEYYEVLDRGYHSGLSRIPANYQMKVERLNSKPTIQPVVNTYNISNVDKVNIQSTDNSVNIKNEPISDIINQLLELAKQLNDEKIELSVKEMNESIGTNGFVNKYCSFIEAVANHITIFAPFIPALTGLIQQCIK